MKLTARELMKIILTRECLTQKELIELVNKKNKVIYNQPGLSRKLNKGTITYNEIVDILDSLGYEIEWKKKD